jgi:hypothetical protein
MPKRVFIVGASFNNFLDALDGSYCNFQDNSEDPTYPDTEPGGYKGALLYASGIYFINYHT